MDYGALVSPLMEFLNQGADKQLGTRKRDNQGNVKMNKWDYVTGRDQQELNDAAAERLRNSRTGEEYQLYGGGDIPDQMRSGEARSEVKRLKELDAAKKEYLRTRGNEGRGALDGIETADEVYKLTGDVNVATEQADAEKPGGRIERMETLDKRYIDSQNLQSMMLGHQMQQSNNQFALQQSQLQLQNRREDAREARGERKDRQMMIMQMMKGLSQMGASIAI